MRRKSKWWTLRALLKPSCWLQNHHYSKWWDEELTRLIGSERLDVAGRCTAKIASRTVWISNHPYASFTPYEDATPEVRPKRSTILWAWSCLEADAFRMPTSDIKELEKLWTL